MGVPDLVILDCDGVLVDSERVVVDVDVRFLGELGWPITSDEVVERFVGVTPEQFVAEVEQRLGTDLPEGWYDELIRRQRAALRAGVTPVSGVLEALDRLAAPVCVASNGGHEKLRLTLEATSLAERFAGRVFSAEDVARGKPAPDLFLHAAERMGAAPQRCVVVEDSPAGVRAGLAAGMRVLAFAGGVVPAARLAFPGVEVFDDMADLPRLLEGA